MIRLNDQEFMVQEAGGRSTGWLRYHSRPRSVATP